MRHERNANGQLTCADPSESAFAAWEPGKRVRIPQLS